MGKLRQAGGWRTRLKADSERRFSGSGINPGPDLGRPSVPRLSNQKHRWGQGLAPLSNVLVGAAKKALAGVVGEEGDPNPAQGQDGYKTYSLIPTHPEAQRGETTFQDHTASNRYPPHRHTHAPLHRKSAGIRQVPSARGGGWTCINGGARSVQSGDLDKTRKECSSKSP